MRKATFFCILVFIFASHGCVEQNSSPKYLLGQIVKSSLQKKCFYNESISIGDNLAKVINLLGEPEEKYNVEGVGYYRYKNYSFGFAKIHQHMLEDDIIYYFDYFIDLKHSEITEILGKDYTVNAFPEYRTFTVNYKKQNMIFEFTPNCINEIEKLSLKFDPLSEKEEYENEAKLYAPKCIYSILTVFENTN